jgi:hypothetical protein
VKVEVQLVAVRARFLHFFPIVIENIEVANISQSGILVEANMVHGKPVENASVTLGIRKPLAVLWT